MTLILIKLSYLFLIFYFGINALPIIDNRSNTDNNTLNLEQKAVLPEHPIDKLREALRVPLALPKFKPPQNFNLTQIANDLKDFGINSLKDDKHIEGLPLDRDGKVNPEFHKEIFLGNHELFESDLQHGEQRLSKKLEEIFNEADLDHDKRLSKEELLNHVFKNVQQHLKEAKDKNSQLFVLIDGNQDGKITWHEYYALYIKFHHMNASTIKDMNDDNFIQESLASELQPEFLKIRYRWTEADIGADNELNIDEFLAFRHPEIAGQSYKYIVEDVISQMDRNDNQELDVNEFVFVPQIALADEHNKEWLEMDKQWLEEQRKEFHEMDENGDGILTKYELLKAYNPLNREHINIQIKKLFSKVDDSPADDSLTLEEIQKHADDFTDIRILDTEKVLHDEV